MMRTLANGIALAALAAALPSPVAAQRVAGAVVFPVGVASRGVASGLTLAPDLALGLGPLRLAASAMLMGGGTRFWLPAGTVGVTSRVVSSDRLRLDGVADVRRDAVLLVGASRSASLGGDALLQIAGGTTVEGSGRVVRQWGSDGAFPGGESSLTAWTGAWRAIDVGASLRSRWGNAREESPSLDSSVVDERQCEYRTRYVDGRSRTFFRCLRGTSSFDVALGVRGGAGPVAVAAWLGRRAAARGLSAQERGDWGTLRVSWATSASTSVVAELGRQPSDVARGIPAHTRAFVGIRLTPFAKAPRSPPAVAAAKAPPRAAIEVGPDVGGVRTITVVAPTAGSVELTGDMTSWRVVALSRDASGRWTTTLPLAPGEYTCNVRIDGGAWIVPPGLPVVDDALGGRSGVLTVDP